MGSVPGQQGSASPGNQGLCKSYLWFLTKCQRNSRENSPWEAQEITSYRCDPRAMLAKAASSSHPKSSLPASTVKLSLFTQPSSGSFSSPPRHQLCHSFRSLGPQPLPCPLPECCGVLNGQRGITSNKCWLDHIENVP